MSETQVIQGIRETKHEVSKQQDACSSLLQLMRITLELFMKKQLLIPVFGFMLFTATAFAAGGQGHHDKMERLTKKLDLSTEQVVQIQQLRESLMPPKEVMRAQRMDTRAQLQALDVEAPEFEQQLSDIADTVGLQAQKAAANRVLFQGKMLTILSPEQREEFAQMQEKRKKRSHH